MSIRKIYFIVFTVLVGLLTVQLFVMSLVARIQQQIVASSSRRYQSYQLAAELRQSSDDLTRMARTYVVTTDPIYEQYFRDILAIRNGKQGRPTNYSCIYWDFVTAEQQPPSDAGLAVPLETLMRRMQFTEDELAKLREAEHRSNELVLLEDKAMNAVKGRFQDKSGAFTIEKAPDLQLARDLMHGRDYHLAKGKVIEPIKEFLLMLDERTNSEVAGLVSSASAYNNVALSILVLGVIFTGGAYFLLKRRVIMPLHEMAEFAGYIRQGDYEHRLQERRSDEPGMLARAFNQMAAAIAQNIAQRERREAELRKLTSAVEQSPSTVMITDIEGNIEYVNPKFTQTTGYTREEAVGENPRILKSDVQGVAFYQDLWNTISAGQEWRGEFCNHRKNGDIYWEMASISPIRDAKERITHFVGLKEDITELRAAQEELKVNEKRFRGYFDNSQVGMAVTSPEKGWLEVNDRLQRMLGYSAEELRQLDWGQLTHPDDRAADMAKFEQMLAGEIDNYAIDKRFIRKDGEIADISLSVACVRDTDGAVDMVLGSLLDISQRKKAERELVLARDRAEAATRAKSEFLSNMSHELRTPLNGVLGYAQLLRQDPVLSTRQKESLDAIESCGQHLLTLINDVLDLSKIEAGRLEINTAPCDFHRLLKEVFDIARPRGEAKGLSVSLTVSPEVPVGIVTDATKLRQALVNLMGNAVKFTKTGSVNLDVHSGTDTISMQVRDTGVGMSEEEMTEIFDPFKQVAAGKSAGGTGLGLTITKSVIEALDGKLRVESGLGQGSCFTVIHPQHDVGEDDLHEVSVTEDDPLHQPVLAPGQDITVLVADDRGTNRDILSQFLQGAGFKTIQAVNGQEALDRLQETPCPLVLMDVRMPVMNGIEATQAIRKDPTLKNTVVIAVTASVLEEFKDQVVDYGFDDFLGKPLKTTELFRKIRKHLGLSFLETKTTDQDEADGPTSVEALTPERAAEVVSQLREALSMRSLTALKGLVAELMEQEITSPVGQRISALVKTFDFEGLEQLAVELKRPTEDS
jgi:PAS domain S-box-containing protein